MKPPILVFVSFGIALATASANASTTPEPHHLQPNAPRSVTVTEAETPPVIRAGLLQSTLILLPAEEKIATVFGGDTVDWVFDGGHVASRFISVKPKLANTTTDMLSQPATNVWLKTKEPNAGEWVSKFIGKVEIERLRETHFDGTRAGRNFTLDRQVEPLVLESEISGLRNLHAYMKYENYVTRFSFPYLELPEVANDFELRHRPDEKLPYNPKELAGREADASASKLEQVPEHSVPTPVHEAPKATEAEPEIALPVVTHHPQNLIMRG